MRLLEFLGFMLLASNFPALVRGMKSPIRVKSVYMTTGIHLRLASTKIKTEVFNTRFTPEDYHYVAFVPKNAFISNFTMEVDSYISMSKVIDYIPDSRDFTPISGILRQTPLEPPKDARLFFTKVTIGGRKSMRFELVYDQVLERVQGVYKLILMPPTGESRQTEAESRALVRILERGEMDWRKLSIPDSTLLHPDMPNQQLLHLAQSKDAKVRRRYQGGMSSIDILFKPKRPGTLIVLYDLIRSQNAGQIQSDGENFVHYFALPSPKETSQRSFVLLLDISRAMNREWDSAKAAVKLILETIKESDRFNIVVYQRRVFAWRLELVAGTRGNIEDATAFLDQLQISGGFFAEIAQPILRDIQVDYDSPRILYDYLVTQKGGSVKDLFDGGEIILAGKHQSNNRSECEVKVTGIRTSDRETEVLVSNTAIRRDTGKTLEKIWAILALQSLLRVAESGIPKEFRIRSLEQAKKISKQYHYLTDATSLFVIPLEMNFSSLGASSFIPALPAESALRRTFDEGNRRQDAPSLSIVREDHVIRLSDSFDPSSLLHPVLRDPFPPPPLRYTTTEAPPIVTGHAQAQGTVPVRIFMFYEENTAEIRPPVHNTEIDSDNLSFVDIVRRANPVKGSSVQFGPHSDYLKPFDILESSDPGLRHSLMNRVFWLNPCESGKLDVVLAIDVWDGRVGPNETSGISFVTENLLKRLITAISFTQLQPRIGLIAFNRFGNRARPVYGLGQSQSPDVMLRLIPKLTTDLVEEPLSDVFRLSYDLFNESPRSANRTVILVSDTQSFSRLTRKSEQLRKMGVKILAISPHQKNRETLESLQEIVGRDESRIFTRPDHVPISTEFCQ